MSTSSILTHAFSLTFCIVGDNKKPRDIFSTYFRSHARHEECTPYGDYPGTTAQRVPQRLEAAPCVTLCLLRLPVLKTSRSLWPNKRRNVSRSGKRRQLILTQCHTDGLPLGCLFVLLFRGSYHHAVPHSLREHYGAPFTPTVSA